MNTLAGTGFILATEEMAPRLFDLDLQLGPDRQGTGRLRIGFLRGDTGSASGKSERKEAFPGVKGLC